MASEGGVASSMAVARRIWFNKSMGLAASRIEPRPMLALALERQEQGNSEAVRTMLKQAREGGMPMGGSIP